MSEWITWIDSVRLRGAVRRYLEAVGLVVLWSIWMFRNKVIFSQVKPVKGLVWILFNLKFFLSISVRTFKFHVFWVDWMCNPCISINSL